LLQWLEASQPWAERAVQSAGEHLSLIVDFARLQPGLQPALAGLLSLPESPFLFELWLESLTLRLVKSEARATISPLGIPNAPWHGFRRRFNSLGRKTRLHLLACLPACDAVPFLSDSPRLPDGNWLVAWKETTDGVPLDALPSTWHKYLREYAPAAIAEKKGTKLILPSCGASPRRRILLPSRKFEKEIGRIFHQAAAWSESKRESDIPLILPDWVIPKSSSLFLGSIQDVLRRNGGLPTESGLRGPLERLMDRLRVDGEEGIASLSPLDLRRVSDDLEAGLCLGASLVGAHFVRHGKTVQGELALQRAHAHAQDGRQVASILANLAALKAASSRYKEAEQLLTEALVLSPFSRLARRNLERLVHFLHGDCSPRLEIPAE
jgi:hypothetical protein